MWVSVQEVSLFLKTMTGNKKPLFKWGLEKSRWAQCSIHNQWHADKHGIVIHYPDVIYVIGSNMGDFKKIVLSEVDFGVDFDRAITVNLLVTQDIICLEFRTVQGNTRALVYHRNSLQKVCRRDIHLGNFFVGEYCGKKELFFKDTPGLQFSGSHIVQIHSSGREETVWKGFAGCDCGNEWALEYTQVFLHKASILRFCLGCDKGNLEHTTTGAKSELFHLPRDRDISKVAVTWHEAFNILAIEERCIAWNIMRSFGLINFETGRVELVHNTLDGDFYRCYAVSQKYLVICYRHFKLLRPEKNILTNMIVKNRDTGETQQFQVPEFEEMIGSLMIVSKSILVAMPCGKTLPYTGRSSEHVYTMDLAEKDPRATIKPLEVPISEVRPLGENKIICKIKGEKRDEIEVHNLF